MSDLWWPTWQEVHSSTVLCWISYGRKVAGAWTVQYDPLHHLSLRQSTHVLHVTTLTLFAQ